MTKFSKKSTIDVDLANLVEEIKNLILSSLISDELIDVSDYVHTNFASQLISWQKRLK